MSFDMHAYLPRCYLNTADCGAYSADVGLFTEGAHAEFITHTDYDVVAKTKTVSAEEDPSIATGDPARLTWTTYSAMDCTEYPDASHLYDPISTDNRYACEKACYDAGDDCTGFSMSWGFEERAVKIAAFYVDGKPPYVGCQMYGPGFDSALCTPGGGNILVMKTPALPCTLTSTFGVVTTSYTRLDEEYFLGPGNASRVVYDSTMECDGWKVQDNTADPIALTFVNCSDHADAAKMWLPDYLAEEFADEWKLDYISRRPELPCENMPTDELEFHIGQTVEEIFSDIWSADPASMPDGWNPCAWLIKNYSATVYNVTGTPVDFTTDLSTLVYPMYNGTGPYGNGTSTLQYYKDVAPWLDRKSVV